MPSNPALTRTSGIEFMVMPPGSTPPSTTVSFIFDDHISDYGGIADGNFAVIPITTTAGSTVISVSSGIFSPGDVGKKLSITPFNGDITIAGYTSSTTITSATAVNITITNSTHCVVWGTDNGSIAWGGNGAFDSFSIARASLSSGTGRLRCSSGVYMVAYGNPLFRYVRNFVLEGANTTLAGSILQLGNPGQHQFESTQAISTGCFHARTSSATAGNSYVDLITSSLNVIFTVGDYATMTGLDLQGGISFPSNPYYFENLLVSAIDASSLSPTYGRISFATPLVNDYLTTWPHYTDASAFAPDHGGPATLLVYYPEWNCDHTYNLAGFAADIQSGINGKTVVFNGTTFTTVTSNNANFNPSGNQSVTFNNCVFGTSVQTIEVDKLVTLATYNNCTINVMFFQSPNNQLRGTGNTINILLGTARDTVLSNCTINEILFGPTSYGKSDSVSLSNCVIGSIDQPGGNLWKGPYNSNQGADSNGITMSSGLISIPSSLFYDGVASSDATGVTNWTVPGGHYLWKDGNRGGYGLFTVESISTNSSNVLIQTDQSSGFPFYSTGAGNFLYIQTHPAPSFQLTACSATAPAGNNDNSLAYNLSQAGGVRPLWSYWRQFNDASVVTTSGAPLWGWLSSATVVVTSDYTGADANPRLDPFGNFCWVTDPSSNGALSPPSYAPKISIASSAGIGTRSWSIDPSTAASVTFTGFKAEDINYNPLAFGPPMWIADRVFGYLDNGVTSGSMSVVTEIKTDQGF